MHDLLKQHFGYDDFRPLQKEIISNILQKKDTFVLMPTGSGKSMCYQLPSLMLDGITLVISPLIALMKDQVDALTANGIPAAAITSALDYDEIDAIKNDAQNGNLKILYVAPERIAIDTFREFLKSLNISLLAIDEAHCISEWGHDFRPEYRNIKNLRNDFPTLPIVALTATATEKVKADICTQLQLKDPKVFISSFNRANLSYTIIPKNNAFATLINLIQSKPEQSIIIYCFSRKGTEKLAKELKKKDFKAAAYHAGLKHETRTKIQENFVKDKIQIIVATIAFGMGINKPDVRLIVHYDLPKTIENYYQETGRAGRDGLAAQCVLFYSYGDKIKQEFFINQMSDEAEKKNAKIKLEKMIKFAENTNCRRKFLLNYFDENWEETNCKNCDNCTEIKENFDATQITQKILSCIIKTGSCFGMSHIIGILRGSKNQKIMDRNHHTLSVYGIVQDFNDTQLRTIINALLTKGIIEKSTGEYPILKPTNQAAKILKNEEMVTLQRIHQPIINAEQNDKIKTKGKVLREGKKKSSRVRNRGFEPTQNSELFEKLRTLRREIADSKEVPAFIIFGDVSLKEMCKYQPKTLEDFAKINGVGQQKLERYGNIFIDAIRTFTEH
ncbi:MAG: DNA helicase RecQ [Patescibacteria group bacterium]